jgi:hypothetical protein
VLNPNSLLGAPAAGVGIVDPTMEIAQALGELLSNDLLVLLRENDNEEDMILYG